METLLRFLKSFAALFVFVLLEVLALVLVYNNNAYQRTLMGRIATNVSAKTYAITTTVTDYFSLKTANRLLAEENAKLREELIAMRTQINDSVNAVVGDSTNTVLITAKVMYNTIDKNRNYLIINKGRVDGVSEDMGVISSNGIVGVVQSVTKHNAVIISALNNLNISGKITRNNFLTSVTWIGPQARYGNVTNIPRHMEPQVGDTVVTSGYSAIFPENIPIGIVREVTLNPTTAEFDACIEWGTNFGTIDYVQVVNIPQREEVQQLEDTINKLSSEK